VAAYIYGYYFSNEFIPNPFPIINGATTYYNQTFSVTIMFLCYNIQPPTLAFFIYKSKPWKEYIWCNILYFLIVVVNVGIGIAFFFLTDQLSSGLNLVVLSKKVEVTIFIIMMITVVVGFVWNHAVDCLKLHEKEFY
jgi:amino acid transporter